MCEKSCSEITGCSSISEEYTRLVFLSRIKHTGSAKGPQPPEETRNSGPSTHCGEVSKEARQHIHSFDSLPDTYVGVF